MRRVTSDTSPSNRRRAISWWWTDRLSSRPDGMARRDMDMSAERTTPRPGMAAGLLAACFTACTLAIYIREISAQDEPGSGLDSTRVRFVIAYLVALALIAAIGALIPPTAPARAGLLCGATVGLGVLGCLALFSIGAGLVAASCFSAAALARVLDDQWSGRALACCALTALLALAALSGGLLLTQ